MHTKRMHNDLSGFAVVELALVIVAVSLIAGTGWWVIKQKGLNDETNGNTQSASESVPVKSSIDKKPLEAKGTTASEISQTTLDNTLSSTKEEDSIDQPQSAQSSNDAGASEKDSSKIGEGVNENAF